MTPTAVVGLSSGEITAAYCVGGLSRSSAWRVAYYRGVVSASLAKSCCEPGAMIAVGLSELAINPYLSQLEASASSLAIGCVNGPQSVTVSGGEKSIEELKLALDRDGVFNRRLPVNVAYHSRHMNEVATVYRELIQKLSGGTRLGKAVMFSSVTGQSVDPDDLSHHEYWVKNMVSPVLFLHAITKTCVQPSRKLARNKASRDCIEVDHFLEIGPHATLHGPIRDIVNMTATVKPVSYSSILIRIKSAQVTALEAMGGLHCKGYPDNLREVNNPHAECCHLLVDLPAYPFNHAKRYWLESRISKNFRFRKFPHHDLLGVPVPDWNPLEPRWRNIISLSNSSWITDHKVCSSSNGFFTIIG